MSKLYLVKSIHSLLFKYSRVAFLLILIVFSETKAQAQQTLSSRIDSIIGLMTDQEKINQLTNNTFFTTGTNTRLNIPGFIMSDGPHGVRYGGNTAFPVGMAMAATFDMNMLFKVGKAMGEEFWVNGVHQQLGPCIDLCRDPRAGRTAESAGEDPFLSGQIGATLINGIQQTPVIATVKHLMVESKQSTRNSSNQIYTDRWMLEHYGYNFRYATQEGGPLSLMDAYNLINGVHCTENTTLLKTNLRQRFGFPFYVVSDWDAIYDSKKALIAGTDICMGSTKYTTDLPDLVSSGSLTKTDLNNAVANVLRTKIMSGMMDYYPTADKSLMNSPAHVAVALECAQESVILLKNTNNILPINKTTVKTIAVIGPNAARGNLNCFGSSEVEVPYSISLLQGLKNRIGASKITYTKGCSLYSTDTSGFAVAKTLAQTADYVIFAGGLDSTLEGEAYNIGNDRKGNTINLPGKQQDLIKALALVNPNLIVVIQSGGVCGINRSINNIKGLLYSFYPGQEGGNALADVIVGDVNPAGRMPVTMPKSDSQLPIWNDDFTDDYGCGYRWFDEKNIVPEFPFGFGLSYTTFAYSNLQFSTYNVPAGTPITIRFDVQNTGNKDGEEVVQLYEHNLSSPLWMPKKELKKFNRIALKSGEKQTVSLTLTAEDFYYWDESHSAYSIEPGQFTIAVGGSSNNLPLIDTLTLTPTNAKPDLKITQIMTMPRYPKTGQMVRCYALIKNQGTAPVLKGTKVTVAFTADNNPVASYALPLTDSIPVGGATFLESTTVWTPSNSGTFLLSATVDNLNTIDEWIETNNTLVRKIDVIDNSVLPTNNLALNKPVTATSIEGIAFPAKNAVDGIATTRWGSTFTDPQTFVVDLKASYNLTKIVVNWEAACAKAYTISVSSDSITWTTVSTVAAGVAGVTNFNVTTTGRYVKILGTARATVYGYSLYELEVYGSESIPPVANAGGDKTTTNSLSGVKLDGSGSSKGSTIRYTWTQLSGPSIATLSGSDSNTLTATNLSAGQYCFKLEVSNGASLKSDVAIITVVGNSSASQTIQLKKGINLISFYVSPNDKSVGSVFNPILPQLKEIKNLNDFWSSSQSKMFNRLSSITDGEAYLVTVTDDVSLTVTGTLLSIPFSSLQKGWNLVGYPKSNQSSISSVLENSVTAIDTIKNFDGYYQPLGTTNSQTTFEPGKGYFIKAISPSTIVW